MTEVCMNLNSLKRSLDELAIDDSMDSMVERFDRIILNVRAKKIKIVELFECSACCGDFEEGELEACACGKRVCRGCSTDTCGVCYRCPDCCTGKACTGCDSVICTIKGEEYSCDECGDLYCEDCSFGWFLWCGDVCFECSDQMESY